MKKRLLIPIILSVICAVACIYLYFYEPPPPPPSVNYNARASCIIRGVGSGALLDTGYIITAAHVVDANNDDILSSNEREVSIGFDGFEDTTKGRVVFFDAKNDIAFVEPVENRYGIKPISAAAPRVGDKIYTVGATLAQPIGITSGHVGYPDENGLGRASCNIYYGNSGGGMFNENHELIGVVSRIGADEVTDRGMVTVPIPRGNSVIFITTWVTVPRKQTVNSVCYYVKTSKIRELLKERKVPGLLDKEPEVGFYERTINDPWRLGLIRVSINVLISLFVLGVFRRHIST